MTKLFVGNLSYTTTSDDLKQLFEQHGPVLSVSIISDRNTGRSKGFGFIEIEDDAVAQDAIQKLDKSEFQGRTIFVSVARPREERPAGSFNRDNRGNDRDNRGGFRRN